MQNAMVKIRATRRLWGVAGLVLLCAVSEAWAQRPPTERLRGAIERIDGSKLTVKAGDGRAVSVTLTDDVRVTAVIKTSFADIKEGSYIGSGAMPQADGSQKAVEVHIFAESQRGTGDGHRPWDGAPNGTMTNGAAGNVVTGVDGLTLTVKYKDGEKKLIVTPETPIVRYELADRGELQPGASVSINAIKKSDGSLEAPRVSVFRGGAAPD